MLAISDRAGFAERVLRMIIPERDGSLRLDARKLDHLAPLLGFLGDELSDVGRRSPKHGAAQVGKPWLYNRTGKCRVDFFVEPVDDVGGCVLRHADAKPRARLVAR